MAFATINCASSSRRSSISNSPIKPEKSEHGFVVRPLSPALGAEILGVDLCDADDAAFEICHRALLDHCVIVIRDQRDLPPVAHIQFSRQFGDLEIHLAEQFLLPGHPEILRISNRKRADGTPEGFAEAGRYWHSDLSYVAMPSRCSLLYAIEVPSRGGDTLFANMYSAYEELSDAMKQRIASLRAVHSYAASFSGATAAGANRASLSAEQQARHPPVAHPVVRTHPETGRQALFVNAGFTTHIEGMNSEKSAALLAELFAASTRSENIYRHVWRQYDLVCWDNRSLMHHATPFDPSATRHMHRTTVMGDRPF